MRGEEGEHRRVRRSDTLRAGRRRDEVVLVVLAGQLLEGLALGFGKEEGREDTGQHEEG
jgi:hypothetical protein